MGESFVIEQMQKKALGKILRIVLGNQRTEQLRWEATANGQTPKQNRAGAKPWEALHGRHFQFQLRVRSRYGADSVRKLVVYTSGRIDHDAVNARGNRGVNGETPI